VFRWFCNRRLNEAPLMGPVEVLRNTYSLAGDGNHAWLRLARSLGMFLRTPASLLLTRFPTVTNRLFLRRVISCKERVKTCVNANGRQRCLDSFHEIICAFQQLLGYPRLGSSSIKLTSHLDEIYGSQMKLQELCRPFCFSLRKRLAHLRTIHVKRITWMRCTFHIEYAFLKHMAAANSGENRNVIL
jgi:hypothetical protein